MSLVSQSKSRKRTVGPSFSSQRRRRPIIRRRRFEQLEERLLLDAGGLSSALPIDLTSMTTAEISTRDEVDFYSVELAEEGRLTVHSIADPALDSHTSLLGSNGELLIQSHGTSSANSDDLIIQHLRAGTYYLSVEATDGGTGEYTLITQFVSATSPADSLVTNYVFDFPFGLQPPYHATGDFNGDGYEDIATSNYYTDDVSVFFGLGDGAFQAASNVPLAFIEGTFRGPFGIVATDFNGDGRLDIATGNQFSGDVSILLGLGDGTFADELRALGGDFNWGLTTGDFDNDDVPDLAAVNILSNDVSILLGLGDGTFQTQLRFPAGNDAAGLDAADLDSDGDLDLVVSSFGSGEAVVLIGNGDGTFEPQKIFAVGKSPSNGVIAGDLNGDEVPDIVIPNTGSQDVSVLLGRGDGTFVEQRRYPAGDSPFAVVARDFDGDGEIDLAVANRQSNNISVLPGRADGTFGSQTTYRAGLNPWYILGADVNNDGHLDLTTSNARSHDVSVLLGLGDGTFQEDLSDRRQAETNPQGMVGHDFDGDGDLDLATVTFLGGDALVFLGRGDGTFQDRVRFSVGSTPVEMVGADFNGDGHFDLATANCDSGDTSVLLGRGDGTFHDEVRYDGAPSSEFILTADFNRDGFLDLVSGGQFAEGAVIILGHGDGTFGAGHLFATTDLPSDGVAADFDEDGHLDVALANVFSADNSLSVYFGRGDGTFDEATRLVVGEFPTGLVTADFNGDGHADLVNTNFGADSVSVHLGDGDGGFAGEIRYPTGLLPDKLLSRDIDEDGHLDLIVSNAGANTLSLLSGKGDGTFEDQVFFATGDDPTPRRGLVAGDFNTDGQLDLATPQVLSSDVAVLLGNGHRHFDGPLRFPVGLGLSDLVSGDFNSDARRDLAGVNPTTNEVVVTLGQGDTTLQNPTHFTTGLAPVAVVQGDFNRDGRLDLVTANHGSDDVSLLLGLGTGSFRDEQRFTVGANPVEMIAVDFNEDGRLDLATANVGSSDVSLLIGESDGTFGPEVRLAAGSLPQALAAADINRDGNLDLVAADYDSNAVTILFGNGDGTFDTPASIQVGQGPIDLLTGDFDSDGQLDLATANYLSHDVSVMYGRIDGTFESALHFMAGMFPVELIQTDFNNDGIVDFGTVNSLSDDVALLLGEGGRRFADSARIATGDYPAAAVADDFNSDGRVDLALATNLDFDVSIFPGLGDATFLEPGSLSAPLLAAPVVMDWNGDGADDVAVVSRRGDILLRLGRTDTPGVFDAPLILNQERVAARDLVLVDTGNGVLLAALDAVNSTVSFYSSGDDGAVTRRAGPVVPGSLSVRMVTGDVNGDARDDLAVLAAGSAEIFVWLQDDTSTLDKFDSAPDYQLSVGSGPSDVALLDLDRDELLDIVVTSQQSGDVSVFQNDSIAPFAAESRHRAGTSLYHLGADGDAAEVHSAEKTARVLGGNFDTDSLLELVVTNSGSNSISVIKTTESGALLNPQSELTFPTGIHPALAVSGRFNDDPHPDLAILNAGSDDISIYLSDGAGGFSIELDADGTPNRVSAGNLPSGLLAHDVTGDGRVDLLVGNEFGDLLILPGNGDGTFQPYQRAGQNIALAIADLNDDGQDDFVFANEALDRVSVQYSHPEQTFAQERASGLLAPGAVSSSDLNRDGQLDLVVANSGANNVLVYLGTGDGQFDSPQSFFAGTNPSSVTIDDLNQDDVLDLVVANKGSNDVTVLIGEGEAREWTLISGPRLRAGAGPTSTLVQDATGDEIPDIFVSNSQSNDLFLLPGVGDGFFDDRNPFIREVGTEPGSLVSIDSGVLTVNRGSNDLTFFSNFLSSPRLDFSSGGSTPVAAIAGDFNRDGTSDLMVANNGDGVVSLLLGQPNGLVLNDSFSRSDVTHPSALATSSRGNQVDVYVVNEGQEAAVLLTSFGIPVPSSGNNVAPPLTDVLLLTGPGFVGALSILTTSEAADLTDGNQVAPFPNTTLDEVSTDFQDGKDSTSSDRTEEIDEVAGEDQTDGEGDGTVSSPFNDLIIGIDDALLHSLTTAPEVQPDRAAFDFVFSKIEQIINEFLAETSDTSQEMPDAHGVWIGNQIVRVTQTVWTSVTHVVDALIEVIGSSFEADQPTEEAVIPAQDKVPATNVLPTGEGELSGMLPDLSLSTVLQAPIASRVPIDSWVMTFGLIGILRGFWVHRPHNANGSAELREGGQRTVLVDRSPRSRQ